MNIQCRTELMPNSSSSETGVKTSVFYDDEIRMMTTNPYAMRVNAMRWDVSSGLRDCFGVTYCTHACKVL